MTADKALMKQAAAQEILGGIAEHVEGMRRSFDVTKGGVAAVEAVLRSLQGVHANLEKDLSDGKVTPEQYKVVKTYMSGELLTVQRIHGSLRDELPAIKARLEGIERMVHFIDSYAATQGREAERILRDEQEEETYRADRTERTPDPPKVQSTAPVAEPVPPPDPTCNHCGAKLTGRAVNSAICVSCTSYRNKHNELPTGAVLESRRRKAGKAHANNP